MLEDRQIYAVQIHVALLGMFFTEYYTPIKYTNIGWLELGSISEGLGSSKYTDICKNRPLVLRT